jgi:4'-phosphopantetheinyl transferase EntD
MAYHEPMPGFAREVPGTPLLLVRAEDTSLASSLTPEERAYADALVHPKRRAEWILGRQAAKAALARVSAASPDEISVLEGPDGAPLGYLHGEPMPRIVSISHGHGQAIAWAGASGQPGVDLERVKPRPEGTFRFYLGAGERERLAALAGGERDAAAVVLWSLKEAAWKALRPSRGVALLDLELGELDLRARKGELAVTPRGAALVGLGPRGFTRMQAAFVRQDDFVYSWAELIR